MKNSTSGVAGETAVGVAGNGASPVRLGVVESRLHSGGAPGGYTLLPQNEIIAPVSCIVRCARLFRLLLPQTSESLFNNDKN